MFKVAHDCLVFVGNGGTTERWILKYEKGKDDVINLDNFKDEPISKYYNSGMDFSDFAYWRDKVKRPRNLDKILRIVTDSIIENIRNYKETEDSLVSKVNDLNIFLAPLINSSVLIDVKEFSRRFSDYKNSHLDDLVLTDEIGFKKNILREGCYSILDSEEEFESFKEWLEETRPEELAEDEILGLLKADEYGETGCEDVLSKIAHKHRFAYAALILVDLEMHF